MVDAFGNYILPDGRMIPREVAQQIGLHGGEGQDDGIITILQDGSELKTGGGGHRITAPMAPSQEAPVETPAPQPGAMPAPAPEYDVEIGPAAVTPVRGGHPAQAYGPAVPDPGPEGPPAPFGPTLPPGHVGADYELVDENLPEQYAQQQRDAQLVKDMTMRMSPRAAELGIYEAEQEEARNNELAFKKYQEAQAQKDAAELEAANKKSASLRADETWQSNAWNMTEFKLNELEQKRADLEKELDENPIDPSHHWNSGETWQNVLGVLSVALGGFSAAYTGRNTALEIMDKAVERDIQAQVQNRAAKERKLGRIDDYSGRVRQLFQDKAAQKDAQRALRWGAIEQEAAKKLVAARGTEREGQAYEFWAGAAKRKQEAWKGAAGREQGRIMAEAHANAEALRAAGALIGKGKGKGAGGGGKNPKLAPGQAHEYSPWNVPTGQIIDRNTKQPLTVKQIEDYVGKLPVAEKGAYRGAIRGAQIIADMVSTISQRDWDLMPGPEKAAVQQQFARALHIALESQKGTASENDAKRMQDEMGGDPTAIAAFLFNGGREEILRRLAATRVDMTNMAMLQMDGQWEWSPEGRANKLSGGTPPPPSGDEAREGVIAGLGGSSKEATDSANKIAGPGPGAGTDAAAGKTHEERRQFADDAEKKLNEEQAKLDAAVEEYRLQVPGASPRDSLADLAKKAGEAKQYDLAYKLDQLNLQKMAFDGAREGVNAERHKLNNPNATKSKLARQRLSEPAKPVFIPGQDELRKASDKSKPKSLVQKKKPVTQEQATDFLRKASEDAELEKQQKKDKVKKDAEEVTKRRNAKKKKAKKTK